MLTDESITENINIIKDYIKEQIVEIRKVDGTEKRRHIVLRPDECKEAIKHLEEHGSQYGFNEKQIAELAGIITFPYVDPSIERKLIEIANPRHKVDSSAIILLLSHLSNASPENKKLLLKWLCLTYPYTTNVARLSYLKLYSVIFFQLDDEETLPFVCHLLYLITTRRSITPYRSRRLLELYQRSLHTGQMVRPLYALLQLYSQYDPSILLPQPPKSSLGYGLFRQVDEAWSEKLRAFHYDESADPGMEESPSEQGSDSFRMTCQLSLQSHMLLSRSKQTFSWPHANTLTVPQRKTRKAQGIEWVTLEQINSPEELAIALRNRHVRLLQPDQSLALLSPAVARFSPFFLQWGVHTDLLKERFHRTASAALQTLLFQERFQPLQRREVMKRLVEMALFFGKVDDALLDVVEKLVEMNGFSEKETMILATFLPMDAIESFMLPIKLEFQKSSQSRRVRLFDNIVCSCLVLRCLMTQGHRRHVLQKLVVFEELQESLFLQSVEDESWSMIASLLCNYLVIQFYNESIKTHVFVPSNEALHILLQTDNASILDGCAQFVSNLCKAEDRKGRSVELGRVVQEVINRDTISTNLALGHLFYHMLEKEPRSEGDDGLSRFKKKLHRYLYYGMDIFLSFVSFIR